MLKLTTVIHAPQGVECASGWRQGIEHINILTLRCYFHIYKLMYSLIVFLQSGALHICIGGVFCATSTASTGGEEHDGGQQSHVMVTCLSRDLKMLSAVSLAPQQHDRVSLQLHTVCVQHRQPTFLRAGYHTTSYVCVRFPPQVEVSLLHQRCRELQYLALHYSSICSLLSYTRATLRCMHEAWEDLLLMVDAKLTRYASVRHAYRYSSTVHSFTVRLMLVRLFTDAT